MPALSPRVKMPTISLSPDDARRANRARDRRGQTWQMFASIAVLDAVEEVEESKDKAKARRLPRFVVEAPASTPSGLGVRDVLAAEPAASVVAYEPAPPAAAPQAPVVVNVNGGGGAPGGGDVNTLARMVVEGPRHERERLLRTACDTLARSAHSEHEALRMAEQLDAEIKRLNAPVSALDRLRARAARLRGAR